MPLPGDTALGDMLAHFRRLRATPLQEGSCPVLHARGLEILELCAAGWQEREIAERLGLGLRLVRRILADLEHAWHEVPLEE